MKKLSVRQQEVIDTLKKGGWSLWSYHSFNSYATFQKGKPQHGGETKRVLLSTLHSLEERGIIERKSIDLNHSQYFLI